MDPQTFTTSPLYTTLAHTATAFLESCRPALPGSNTVNREKILTNLSSDFQASWGHTYFISTAPPLQGTKTAGEFVEHLETMAAKLHTWEIEITQLLVDESKRSVMARGDFSMTPVPGSIVLNDIIFIMKMNESGEKVVEFVEFVDPCAAGEIRRLMEG